MRSWTMAFACGLSALPLLGCGDDTGPSGGEGSITFTTWGEEYIEDTIPASDFADDHTVVYSKFVVVLGNIKVQTSDGTVAAQSETLYVIDHTEPGVKELVKFEGIEAATYPRVSYELAVPTASSAVELVGSVTQADADFMISNAYNVYVEGTVSGAAGQKTFAWGFGIPTLLDECEGERDGTLTQGAVVTDGGEDIIELTIHGDHFFYDDLQSAAAELRGEAIVAADSDNDGTVTQEELAAVALIDLPVDQYGTGGAGDVNDLGAFLAFLSRTVGHFRGEGECFVKSPTE